MTPPPDRVADLLDHAARALRRNGRTALARNRDLDSRGYPPATGGGGNPQLNDDGTPPGLHRHLGPADGGHAQPNPFTWGAHTLDHWVASAFLAAAAIIELTARLANDLEPQGRRDTASVCAEGACPEILEHGRIRRGRCPACAEWVRAWEHRNPGKAAPPVPADVIDARRQRRRSGSLASDFPPETRDA